MFVFVLFPPSSNYRKKSEIYITNYNPSKQFHSLIIILASPQLLNFKAWNPRWNSRRAIDIPRLWQEYSCIVIIREEVGIPSYMHDMTTLDYSDTTNNLSLKSHQALLRTSSQQLTTVCMQDAALLLYLVMNILRENAYHASSYTTMTRPVYFCSNFHINSSYQRKNTNTIQISQPLGHRFYYWKLEPLALFQPITKVGSRVRHAQMHAPNSNQNQSLTHRLCIPKRNRLN
jgi:hypothetical protein